MLSDPLLLFSLLSLATLTNSSPYGQHQITFLWTNVPPDGRMDGHFFIYAKFKPPMPMEKERNGKFLPFIEEDISSDKSSPKSRMIYFVLTFQKKD